MTLRPISRVSVLGKSVLPRVLVRVTLLLPAHLPVLIGQRVSHSGGCRLVLCVVVARAPTLTPTPTLNTYLRKLESWDQYGGRCV